MEIYVFLYQNLNYFFVIFLITIFIYLCISILEFKYGNKEQEDLDAAKFMYFYIRI